MHVYSPHDIILHVGEVCLPFELPLWMILNGQTVGGLTMSCVDAFTTRYHIEGRHIVSIISTIKWMILSGDTIGGLTVYSVHAVHMISYRAEFTIPKANHSIDSSLTDIL